MLFPSQTSLIPVTVALSSFFAKFGFKAFSLNYPYWYLGTTPYKYLTGPIVPIVESLINGAINVSLFNITIYLIILTYALSVLGWVLLLKKMGDLKNRTVILFTLLLLLFPWRLFSSLTLSEGSLVMAQNLIPFVLLSFWALLEKPNLKRYLFAVLTTLFLLLINTGVLPVFLVGLMSLTLAESFREGKLEKVGEVLKRTMAPFLLGFAAASFWYGPSYWLTILFNPSLGGVSGLKVIVKIFNLLRSTLPLFLAVVAVYFTRKIKDRKTVFILTWVLTFSFLTFFRFLSDPDFWQDWTTWFSQLEIGLVFILVFLKPKSPVLRGLFVLLPFVLTFFVFNKLGKPALLGKVIPEGVRSLEQVSEIVGTQRVFLSGATVFWANALYDINQVRGGRDGVARDDNWAKGAWVLRESPSSEETKEWVDKLGVSYVLIHPENSPEYYHDFKFLEKWPTTAKSSQNILEDVIYAF